MKSMTGYGSGSAAFPGGRISVELRAVNHRFLEIKPVLPREFAAQEAAFRECIESKVKRGRIDLTLTCVGRSAQAYAVTVNMDLARLYYQTGTQLQRDLKITGQVDMGFLLSRPDLFQVTETAHVTDAEARAAQQALQHAVVALERQRNREGRFLQRDLRARVATLAQARRAISERRTVTQEMVRQKLSERVSSLLHTLELDHSRLLQEVATVVQKSDITEELVRLQSHLQMLTGLLRARDPVGKRIDFLLQEVQREVNTIGAKSDDAAIRHLVVTAKEAVEKLREQVQNIE